MTPWQRNVTGSGRVQRLFRSMRSGLSDLWVMKTPLLVMLALLAYLPLPLLVEGKESRCAYILMVMATLWLTEALPIPVTALLPVAMFPMAGILTAKDVGHSYLSNTSMLFIGGLVVAIGVEECHLHKRVALAVLKRVGAEPKWIMLGLMLPTWFLSMWISNTATASMMIPIVEAVLLQIKHASDSHERSESKSDTDMSTQIEDVAEEKTAFLPEHPHKSTTTPDLDPQSHYRVEIHPTTPPVPVKRSSLDTDPSNNQPGGKVKGEKVRGQSHARLAKALSLCVAYSANVGGIATLTGTPPNLVLKGQVDMFFDKYGAPSPLSFIEWMGLAFPLSLLLLALCWLWLVVAFLNGCCQNVDERQKKAVTATIQREYKAMGPVSFAEVETTILFAFLALVWVSRDPKFMPGWNVLFESDYVSDATGAILVALLFFILPARKPPVFCWRSQQDMTMEDMPSDRHYVPLLTWSRAQEKLPWGIIVLLGGGFALAKACKFSGLSLWVGEQLSAFGDLDPWILNLIICTAVAMATEVTSNVATATLLMPIMAELALRIGVNPMYLMSSSALATSFAFMMPVATPPNAIVFSHGHLSIPDMAKVGVIMNITAVLVLTVAVNTWGDAIFDFSTLPDVMKNVTSDVIKSAAP